LNYQEIHDKIVAYAIAIRSADPAAKVVGPQERPW
jgi:Glycoside hydrolase family 44